MSDLDHWPSYFPATLKEHLYATGVLVAAWQAVEDAYRALFQLINPGGDMAFTLHAFDLMGNDTRAALIQKDLVRLAPSCEASLLNFLRCAAICKENRNAIAHSVFWADPDPSILALTKGLNKARDKQRRYRFTVAALREMADDTQRTATYGLYLFAYITLERAKAAGTMPPDMGFASPIPLPGTLPQPRKWETHSQEPLEGAPPPPQPSRA